MRLHIDISGQIQQKSLNSALGCVRDDGEERSVFIKSKIKKEILMKYKGNGLLHCRNGTGMNRVGFFGYLQGQQYVDGMLDYRTNVNSMKVLMELST